MSLIRAGGGKEREWFSQGKHGEFKMVLENFDRSCGEGGSVSWRQRGEKNERRGGIAKEWMFAGGNAEDVGRTVNKPTWMAKAMHVEQ